MIDGDDLSRHYIVKKENEITEISTATESNIVDEEVLFKALGHSVFDIVRKKNIIFEGWKDLKLYKTAISKVPSKYSSVKELKEVGVCYSRGVKQIGCVSTMIELANRKCIIISDNDTVALEKKAEHERSKQFGKWYTCNDIKKIKAVVTGEDFVITSSFNKPIGEVKQKYSITNDPDLTDTKGVISAIKSWLYQNNIKDQHEQKQIIRKIKDEIFNNLKQSQIKEDYYQLLHEIIKIINAMK